MFKDDCGENRANKDVARNSRDLRDMRWLWATATMSIFFQKSLLCFGKKFGCHKTINFYCCFHNYPLDKTS